MLCFVKIESFWLNFTNIALAILALLCVVVVAYALGKELAARKRKRQAIHAERNADDASVSELGFTMADGGEPISPDVQLYVSDQGLTSGMDAPPENSKPHLKSTKDQHKQAQ